MQFPITIRGELTRLTTPESVVIKNAFYTAYSNKRDRCIPLIENLLLCYRVFKEMRNCYMHNGMIADDKLVNAYNEYILIANESNLGVSELPIIIPPILGNPIAISLRGIVGFSYILIKIIVTLDTELLRSVNAELEFIKRYRTTHKNFRTLKTDMSAAEKQVKQYIIQCKFPVPPNTSEMLSFLLDNRLVSR